MHDSVTPVSFVEARLAELRGDACLPASCLLGRMAFLRRVKRELHSGKTIHFAVDQGRLAVYQFPAEARRGAHEEAVALLRVASVRFEEVYVVA